MPQKIEPEQRQATDMGQWGPQGPQMTTSVRASLRALFDSAPFLWASRIVLLLTLAFVTWQSLTPITPSSNVPYADKIMHAIAYAGVAGLMVWSGLRSVVIAILGATLWGAGIEIAQAVMALGREGSLADGFANAAGAALGAGITIWMRGGE
jgi:VanZ family protein